VGLLAELPQHPAGAPLAAPSWYAALPSMQRRPVAGAGFPVREP